MDKQLYNFYANDKLGFFVDHVLIPNNKSGKITKIELFGWKQQILHADNILIKKARNLGITELLAADIAYNLNFKNDFDMLYMTINLAMSQDIKHKVVRHFSNIPDNIRIGLKAGQNKNTYETVNNNMVQFSGDNPSVGCSMRYNEIYLEEVDSFKDFYNTFSGVAACLSIPDGRMVITATPLSGNSHFHMLWNNPANKFDKLELTYQSVSTILNKKRKKSLNDISKTAYSKIIREWAI